jgi:hypothetical protein
MIISYKYKYIFVGLPNSGSSAISKELIENYLGESIQKKHSSIPYFILNNKIDIKDYFVFGVYRDPIDISFSQYNKIKVNAKGAFTNLELLKENGGYVSKQKNKFFRKVQENCLTFEEFIVLKYKYIPYDNLFSINKKYFDYVIQFSDLNNGFLEVLKRCKLEPVRNLPEFNVTDKKDTSKLINPNLISKVFSPFYYSNSIGALSLKMNWMSYIKYKILKPIRWVNVYFADKNRNDKYDSYFGSNK